MGPVGSGVNPCVGPCRLVCETLLETHVDSSVSPCLGHLLRTPAKAVPVVNLSLQYLHGIAWEQKNHQQAVGDNFKKKTCSQFSRSLMQHLSN